MKRNIFYGVAAIGIVLLLVFVVAQIPARLQEKSASTLSVEQDLSAIAADINAASDEISLLEKDLAELESSMATDEVDLLMKDLDAIK